MATIKYTKPSTYNFKDLSGQKYNRLKIIAFAYTKNSSSYFECICDCGVRIIAKGTQIVQGNTKSCGCIKMQGNAKTHGRSNTSEYRIYKTLTARCYNQKSEKYIDYGHRGIKVCDRWLGNDGFVNFLADMGERPSPRHSIDRINNNGNYSPENCRWATPKEQSNNTRRNRKIEFNGVVKSIAEWSNITSISPGTIFGRIKIGWCEACSITIPVKRTQRYFACPHR